MKRYSLKVKSCTLTQLMLAVVLSFTGCGQDTKIYKLDISKNGKIGLENILEIHSKYSKYDIFSGNEVRETLRKHYSYDGNPTKEALEKAYRLSLYIDLNDRKLETNYILGVVLLPCKLELEYSNYDEYPVYNSVSNIEYPTVKPYTYLANFKVEELEELGYITKDKNQQKNLCLFVRYTTENMTNKYKVSSNKLIYTAKEINEIMDEYEGLR